ncbi:unnamed protein product [Rotaria sordida]|uniref:ADP ribosyltransferase domain-containing protein n=1 Tax=Rotaria sordida TaxID=392033 RepID=A0A813WEX1_9BILA|nr:unnamed protein product [Rotaria sordida]CAF1421750.1 unnamed protein product [Rotaria sordida]
MAIPNFPDSFCTSLSDNENFETTTLIWLGNILTELQENRQIQRELRSIINHIRIFDSIEECKNYIQHLSRDDRVVLITNGRLGKEFVPCIHHFRQMTSIYIFCMDKKKNEMWPNAFIKIKGVFISLDELVKKLKCDQERQMHGKIDEPLSINVFTTRHKADQSTTALNLKFVHQNLFLDSLLQIKPTIKDTDEFISRCLELYKDNPSQLSIIYEFQETYRSDQALWWYTRETFLYRLLNKALRIQNIGLLFVFRFFIYDIQRQLEIDQCSQAIRIYRGQLMSQDEIKELENSIGDHISINSFFSTSLNKNYVIFLMGDVNSIHNGLQRVLFEIDANPNHIGIKPFADISSRSYFPNECEVLITLGAIFRLNNIILNEENIWVIHLSLCSDQDNDLKYRIDQIKRQYNDQENNVFSFGSILHQMKKYDDAEKYYRRLLTEFSDDYKQTGLCYYHLGRVYSGKGNYKDSIKWYEKSLKIMMETMSSDDLNIATCFNSIGNIYRKTEDYNQALEAYQKALNIWTQALGENHLKVAMCLINMGVIHNETENYIDALKCLEKALKIKQRYHGINHSDVAALYNNIGLVHEQLDHFDFALENFKRALEIYRTSFYIQNIDYGLTLENIGHLYKNYEKWRPALRYLEEAQVIYHHLLSATDPRVVQIEQDIRHISSVINN